MRRLHRPELWSWSRFDAARNVDFNGLLIVREGGNVVIDPMPLSEHDAAHLDSLGTVAWVVITNPTTSARPSRWPRGPALGSLAPPPKPTPSASPATAGSPRATPSSRA